MTDCLLTFPDFVKSFAVFNDDGFNAVVDSGLYDEILTLLVKRPGPAKAPLN